MSSPQGALALWIDELIRDADPATTAALLDSLPAGLADQLTAAARHNVFRAAAAIDSGHAGGMPLDGPNVPGWVTLGLATELGSWGAGTSRTCPHAPTALRPQPIHIAAWRPGLVVCQNCLHLLRPPRRAQCSACGTTPTGDPNKAIGWLVAGFASYGLVACDSCRYWTPDSEHPGRRLT